MSFSRVLQLILMFYNLAVKKASAIAEGSAAGNGARIYTQNGTLIIRTGYSADKTIDGNLDTGTMTITISDYNP